MIVTDPRAAQKQIGTWVDRQTHDEFALMAKDAGVTKAELLRQMIEARVSLSVRAS